MLLTLTPGEQEQLPDSPWRSGSSDPHRTWEPIYSLRIAMAWGKLSQPGGAALRTGLSERPGHLAQESRPVAGRETMQGARVGWEAASSPRLLQRPQGPGGPHSRGVGAGQ